MAARLVAPARRALHRPERPRERPLRAPAWHDARPMASTPAIEVRDLRKTYGELEAVRGIDFSVERGEIYGLLGPNGAGKTSTVEILEGYRQRTSGTVSVLGYDPQPAPARAARSASGSCCSRAASTARCACARWSRTSPASTRTRATSTR